MSLLNKKIQCIAFDSRCDTKKKKKTARGNVKTICKTHETEGLDGSVIAGDEGMHSCMRTHK